MILPLQNIRKTDDIESDCLKVLAMVVVLNNGGTLPAVHVKQHADTNQFVLMDGHHRLAAHKRAGRRFISAEVTN